MTFVPNQAVAQMNVTGKIKSNFYLLPSLVMVGSALLKILRIVPKNSLYEELSLQNLLIYLGVIELISVIFYLFRPTMLIGFFFICACWGGVISASIACHMPVYLPVLMLLLFGLSLYWRDPSLFKLQEKSYE